MKTIGRLRQLWRANPKQGVTAIAASRMLFGPPAYGFGPTLPFATQSKMEQDFA
jgi:hypothetical protein